MTLKKALVIGIDDYPGEVNDLKSCINDAQNFAYLLNSIYEFDEVKTLLNQEATVAKIEDELDWLFSLDRQSNQSNAKPDDLIVFYYSGHGYQQERNGVMDECLVCTDGFLFDNSLSKKTQNLPPGILTVILDSCFSGGMEKAFYVLTEQGRGKVKTWIPQDVETDERLISSFKKDFIETKPFGTDSVKLIGTRANTVKEVDAKKEKSFSTTSLLEFDDTEAQETSINGLLITACKENETASSATHATKGLSAFTYCLLTTLHNRGKLVSNNDLLAATSSKLTSLGFPQTPLIKEPSEPTKLGSKSFIELNSLSSNNNDISDKHTSSIAMDDIIRVIIDAMKKSQSTKKEVIPNHAKGDKIMPLSKPFQPTSAAGSAKNILDDITDVLPIVIQVATALKEYQPSATKPFQPTSAGSTKSVWGDIADVIPDAVRIVSALTKEYQPSATKPFQPTSAAGSAKNILDDITDVLPIVIQVATALKEYQPSATKPFQRTSPGNGKSFWDDVTDILPTVIQVASTIAAVA